MAQAKEHIYKAFVSINIMASFFLLYSSSIIWQIYIYGQLKTLLQQYGFAKIPPAELPIGVEYSDSVVLVCSVVWFLAILVCLFYSFLQLYMILKTTLKKKMYYTYRMTVVSTLIPLFNLYRPWAGLSEVRKEFISRRSGHATYKDYATIVFAIFLITSLLLIIRTLSYVSLITKSTESYASGLFDALIIQELICVSLVVFVTLITYFYCYNVINAARDVISK
jgi:hypothetical protein